MNKLKPQAVAVMVKKTSSLGTLMIRPVDKQTAKEMIVENHYSHKWISSFGVYNFGIFRIENPEQCLGVAAYGYIKNPRAKLFTHPNPHAWMCELNRMWISDELGKNAESILVSCSIKLLRKMNSNIVAVQSFADGRLGCGTIYKAANFKYYGFHYTRFLRNKRSGEVIHEQLFTDTTNTTGYLRTNISFLLNEYEVFDVKTYRYIYPLCDKFRFKKKEQSYPPYERGEVISIWERDRKKIKGNIVRLLEKVS